MKQKTPLKRKTSLKAKTSLRSGGRIKSKTTKKTAKKKSELQKIKEKLWEVVRSFVKKRDGPICIPCKKEGLSGAGQHGGHFIPSSTCGMFLRYDIRNVHSSCYHCNINLGGNGAMFYKSLEESYGSEFVENIFKDKNKSVKWGVKELELMMNNYKALLDKTPKELKEFTLNYKGLIIQTDENKNN